MDWSSFKQRILDNAIETGLSVFWGAVWTSVVILVGIVCVLFKGVPFYWITALIGALVAFLLVVIATATLAIFRRNNKVLKPVGRRGFMDYKIQSARALNQLNEELESYTRQISRIGRQATKGTKRMLRARNGWFGSDERHYRASLATAERVSKDATIMRLHADRYAAEVALFIEGSEKWFEWTIKNKSIDHDELATSAKTLAQVCDMAATTISTMDDLKNVVEENRASSASMDIAGGELIDAVNVFIESTGFLVAYCNQQSQGLLALLNTQDN